VANGLGFLPVQMVIEEGSFLKVAVDRELGQLAKAAYKFRTGRSSYLLRVDC
jgi:hypothetical protein